MQNLSENLVKKSIEAFIMGLEIYNKPSIKYRIEGFSFFICNSWELMLKAHLIKSSGESSIYYSDNNRTISLSEAIGKIYTDNKQPLRINLEKIIELRNESTHLITEDYETIYAPFFQSCVHNFSEQINRFHGISISDYIPQNFLVLSVDVNVLTNEEINAKYSKETASKFIEKREELNHLMLSHTSNDLYIPLNVQFFQTRNKEEADVTFGIDKDADEKVRLITRMQDPANKFNLSRKSVIDGVNKQLNSRNIPFNYKSLDDKNLFNNHTLTLITNYYDLKNDDRFIYQFGNSVRYSQQLVTYIVDLIRQSPDIINIIQKKIAPGS